MQLAPIASKHSGHALALALLALLGLPLLLAAWAAALAGWDLEAWRGLLAQPQTLPALAMTLWTGLAASMVSWLLCAWLLGRYFPGPGWAAMVRSLGPLLALPHAAFAIGLVLLIAPSGWLLRALSPWATGFTLPPPWSSTQDPWGLGLIAVLVAKELPFLLWAAASQLQRADVAQRWSRELLLARSMGYSRSQAWWRVLWPQLGPRLRWPMLAVLAYSLTVVDVALVIGPSAPPTLAVLTWQWLLDADVLRNAQGAAGAWLLALTVGLLTLLLWLGQRDGAGRARWSDGRRGRAAATILPPRNIGLALLLGLYLAVLLALAVGSVSGVWTFPALLPQSLTLEAWRTVADSLSTVGTTLSLALAAAAAALVWSVLWLESAPAAWDRVLRQWVYLPLALPAVLWVIGVHGLTLRWGIDATWPGLWLAHSLACVPYVLIALSPAYLGFDPRLRHVAQSLGHAQVVFLWRIKWPLLRAALASGFAVGFAVSVAQYLPTVFIGAGRYSTVTTEAVALASGAQRSLGAAHAWLLWLLPALVFGAAAMLGRPRRF